MSYLEKFYNILQGYVCCPLTLDDVNPHWSVDVVRYRAGVVALVHRARLSIFFSPNIYFLYDKIFSMRTCVIASRLKTVGPTFSV